MRFPRGQGGERTAEEMALFDWYLWDGMARIEAFGDTHGAGPSVKPVVEQRIDRSVAVISF